MRKILVFLMVLAALTYCYADDNTQITANYLKSIQHNPLELRQFFYPMPKGGDIHNHIDGAAYAEDLIKLGAKENFCVEPKTFAAYQSANCPAEYQLANIMNNPKLYQDVVNAWSMNFFPFDLESGLPHFFDTFPGIEPIVSANLANVIASIANRAGRQNELYLELMIGGLEFNLTNSAGKTVEQIGSSVPQIPDLNQWRQNLLNAGLTEIVNKTNTQMQTLTQQVNQIMQCSTNKAASGCSVTIRYQYFALRDLPLPQFYAELVTGFAVAATSPTIVGINIVRPENWNSSLANYTTEMKMIGFLRTVYPSVHVTLHAGELAFGQVPPQYLTYHINQAVNIAHADRIGHGVDIAYEKNSQALLNEMAKKHIDVEINLTSNKDVLGISGNESQLPLYLKNHVPVTLSTDDEGIERTDLTNEYVSAELQYGLSYATLKNMARNNLQYGFIQGQSLWQDDDYQHVVSACATDVLGSANPSPSCQAFLTANKKAALQWQLEHQFSVFESGITTSPTVPS